MASLSRVVVEWSGQAVKGLSVNVLHFLHDGAGPSSAGILAAYSNLAGRTYSLQKITVPNTGEIIESTTGDLVGVWTSSGGGVVSGAASNPGPAGVGACVTWSTGAIIAGRHVKGRTFLCPLAGDAYESDGTLTAAFLTNGAAFITALQAAGTLEIWHRPTSSGGSDGAACPVVSGRMRDHVAYLSSRRD